MANSKKSHEGYLFVDHRASPGLPADFYHPLGMFDVPVATEGKMVEAATLTCSHCTNVVILNPERTRERPYCRKCDHYICDTCEGISRLPGYIHTPFKRLVDLVYDQHQNSTLLLSQLKET